MLFAGPAAKSDNREPSYRSRGSLSGYMKSRSQRFADISGQVISDAAQQEESLIFINMSDASRQYVSLLLPVTRFVGKSH